MGAKKKEETFVSSSGFQSNKLLRTYPGRTLGETKKSNSASESDVVLDLNRCPRIGIDPSTGTCV